MQKNEKRPKKYFNQLFGVLCTQKLVKIHNTLFKLNQETFASVLFRNVYTTRLLVII